MFKSQTPNAKQAEEAELLACLKRALAMADLAGFALAAIHIQSAIDTLQCDATELEGPKPDKST